VCLLALGFCGIVWRVPFAVFGLAAFICKIIVRVSRVSERASGPSRLGAKGFPLGGGAGLFCLLLSDVWAVSSLGISRFASCL